MTPEQREAILDTLRTGGTLGQALRGAGVRVRAWAEAVAADEALRDVAAEAARVGGEARAAREKEASDGEQGQGEGDAATRVSGSGVGPVVASEPRRKDGPARRDEGEAQADSAREAGGETVDERVVRLPWSAQSKGPEPCERPGLPGADPGQRLVVSSPRRGGVADPAPSPEPPAGPPSSTPPAPAPQARLAEWQRAPGGRERFAEPIAVTAAREDEERREVAALDVADPLTAVAIEAGALAPGMLGYVLLVDARCVAAGMPPMSPWWRWSVGGFLDSGKPWGIWDVGRGGGKSTTWERVAAALARYGDRSIPPGQTWTAPFISVGPDDANRRINGIAAVFRADGLAIVGDWDVDGEKVKEGVRITRAPRGSLDLLDIRQNPIQLASVAGTIGNVSGPSTVFLLVDEAAKLHDKASNASPLTEIIASASQTSRGRPGWRGIICSSAFDRAGLHFQLVQQGTTQTNYVATIGPGFIDAAVAGFEDVATWEQRRGDVAAAKIIREHAAGLRADSPLVPTWTANPTIGNPRGESWDGAALATRMLVEVLPEEALEGVPRVLYWLRENGSLPLDRGAGGANAAAQCMLAARITAAVTRGGAGRAPTVTGEPMRVAGAAIGDPRHPGTGRAQGRGYVGWRRRAGF